MLSFLCVSNMLSFFLIWFIFIPFILKSPFLYQDEIWINLYLVLLFHSVLYFFNFVFCHSQHLASSATLNPSPLLPFTFVLHLSSPDCKSQHTLSCLRPCPSLRHGSLLTSFRIPVAFAARTTHTAVHWCHSLVVNSAFPVASWGLEAFAHDSVLPCSYHGLGA